MFAYVDRSIRERKRFQRFALARFPCGAQQPSRDSCSYELATRGKIRQSDTRRILEEPFKQLLGFFIFSGEPRGEITNGIARRRRIAFGDFPRIRVTKPGIHGADEREARAASRTRLEVRLDFLTLRNTFGVKGVLSQLVFAWMSHDRSDRTTVRAFFRHRWSRKRT